MKDMDLPETGFNDSAQVLDRLQTLEHLLAIQATTLEAALTEASNVLVVTFQAEKIDVFLYDEANTSLIAVGTSETPMGQLQRQLGLHRAPIANGGRSVQVFQTGQPYYDGHVDEDAEEIRGIREALGIRSQMIVPLEVAGNRRGVLNVASAKNDHFSAASLQFLQTVAYWVGMIMERAELVEWLTRETTEQTRRLVAEELVTILAHDLGNYLTPLVGRSYILRARAEREGRTADVHDARLLYQGLQRFQRLIDDLLNVGRIEQGLFTVVRQPVNLSELASTTAAALQTPQFAVELRLPDELIAEVDADRIQQALENLLINAQRHAPDSPVVLSLQREQRDDSAWAVLSVQDQGPGIAPEIISRLMDRFARGQRSRGLGLGLYLARKIAEAHGGSLSVESVLGKGTTFRLAVPIVGERGSD
ncbi:MAG TPA: GAF domain-containing sensor histidine kinase [Herpetosiphonaceae bacterium]